MLGRRRLLAIITAVLVLATVAYAAAGVLVYERMSGVAADCGGRFAGNTPAHFSVDGVDTRPYAIASYDTVSFPSRDPAMTISAWYAPAATPASRTVIVVHGLGDCKRHPQVLLAAGMLHRHGFGVLLVDLRNHGDSTVEDGRYWGGVKEHRDVLGAWDWLQREKGLDARTIGLMGFSMGASTVMDAAGVEPRVAAVWEDSGLADPLVAIQEELERKGYPGFVSYSGVLMIRLLAGIDVLDPSPDGAASRLAGRPVFIVHGDADRSMYVHHATDLAAAIRQHGGGNVEVWIVHGAAHIDAIRVQPDAYEQRLVAFFTTHLGSG